MSPVANSLGLGALTKEPLAGLLAESFESFPFCSPVGGFTPSFFGNFFSGVSFSCFVSSLWGPLFDLHLLPLCPLVSYIKSIQPPIIIPPITSSIP